MFDVQVLTDFFPASDVVNRVISEFISPGQPHPALLAGVLKQIFAAAVAQVGTTAHAQEKIVKK